MNQPSNLNLDLLDVQITNVTGSQQVASQAGHASVLANANNVRIKNSIFSIGTTNTRTETKSTLQDLYQRVAPNAILNDGGRADDAKCFPGTREEVIDVIEKWADGPDSNRILWLSGPAGGGKTAIMKTIVERAANWSVPTINFFFFRGDSSRQSIQPVVPTLLYQFFEHYPESEEVVAEIISSRPRILDGSIAQQCKLISALFPIIRQSSPVGTPIVLLVDGLDECDVDANRSQGDILRALEGLLTADNSPFRLLLASRPEARIHMAFNHLSLHAQSVFLDEEYRPEEDIRRFVVAEFDRIKAHHPSAHRLPLNWPSSSDVEGIVIKSSGQFIFSATVMRYIAHASTVPSLSLERVQGIVPSGNNSPFMHLDSIYIFILLQVDDLDTALAMFSLEIAQHSLFMLHLHEYNSRYTAALMQSCASELSAIVKLTDQGTLAFYHASLPDFLTDKARSGKYWIDMNAFRMKMLVVMWNEPPISPATYRSTVETFVGIENLQNYLFLKLDTPTKEITHSLFEVPVPRWIIWQEGVLVVFEHLPGNKFFETIEKLYYNKDNEIYHNIILQLIPKWARILAAYPIGRPTGSNPHAQLREYPLMFREYMTFLSTGGVAEWARAVGYSNVVRYSITSILRPFTKKVLAQTPDPSHPKTLYLRKRSIPRTPSPSAPETQPLTPSSTRPHILASAPPTKALASEPSQQPRPSGTRAGVSPALRRSPAASTAAHVLSTPLRASSSQPSHPPARKPSQALSRSTGAGNARGGIITAAGSGRSSSSATRATGRGLRNVTPPKASGSAETQMATKSGRKLLGAGPTSTPRSVRGKSQHSSGRGDGSSGKGGGDKSSIVFDSGAAVVNNSTAAKPAPQLGSKSHSPLPASRPASSLQANAREKGATPKPGATSKLVWRG